MNFLKPKWARDWWQIINTHGIRHFIKQKGWKFFVAFFLFYLVRDATLYIIIPYFTFSKITGCE
jgi:hypothetical protein